jgi:hypothetical protein
MAATQTPVSPQHSPRSPVYRQVVSIDLLCTASKSYSPVLNIGIAAGLPVSFAQPGVGIPNLTPKRSQPPAEFDLQPGEQLPDALTMNTPPSRRKTRHYTDKLTQGSEESCTRTRGVMAGR